MRANYKRLGTYIREVVEKNSRNQIEKLLGVSIQKCFIPSIANTIGTDMTTYKIVRENQFAYGPVTSRNGDKISVALLQECDCTVSTSYTVFEIINHNELLPEYLMMWFRRPEFDRYARFMSHGSVREIFGWEEMCNVELPIPSLDKQKEIVVEYNTIVNRIKLNEQLNQKLEETAQALYKHWFVDFEFPISKEYAAEIGKPELEGRPYKSSGSKMVWNDELNQEIPEGWGQMALSEIVNTQYGFTASAEQECVGPKFLRITDIAKDYIEWDGVPHCRISSAELSKYLLKDGDVVVARTGATVGYAKRLNKNFPKSIFASYLVRLTPKVNIYHDFIGITVTSNQFKEYIQKVAGGSGQPQASATLMTEYKLVVPQKNSLIKFNQILNPLLNMSENYQLEITQLLQLKSFLHSKMTKSEATA
ncbi:MAG: restriction endonuclease subunit S [SAR324 cluster bacterium]|nr:restriction endonuclease subunit S [SAR324 cluster bacterium]